jgi:hypothetical protein
MHNRHSVNLYKIFNRLVIVHFFQTSFRRAVSKTYFCSKIFFALYLRRSLPVYGAADGVIRIPDEALQELELDVGDAAYLIAEFAGNTRCLILSKKPQIADRIDGLTGAWNSVKK